MLVRASWRFRATVTLVCLVLDSKDLVIRSACASSSSTSKTTTGSPLILLFSIIRRFSFLRNGKTECAALSVYLGFFPDTATVYFNNTPDNSQADSGPFAFLIQLIEEAKDIFVIAWFYSHAVITNAIYRFSVIMSSPYFDKRFVLFAHVFYRIINQVLHYLHECAAVEINYQQVGRNFYFYSLLFFDLSLD